jgi:hypothetical protein
MAGNCCCSAASYFLASQEKRGLSGARIARLEVRARRHQQAHNPLEEAPSKRRSAPCREG